MKIHTIFLDDIFIVELADAIKAVKTLKVELEQL